MLHCEQPMPPEDDSFLSELHRLQSLLREEIKKTRRIRSEAAIQRADVLQRIRRIKALRQQLELIQLRLRTFTDPARQERTLHHLTPPHLPSNQEAARRRLVRLLPAGTSLRPRAGRDDCAASWHRAVGDHLRRSIRRPAKEAELAVLAMFKRERNRLRIPWQSAPQVEDRLSLSGGRVRSPAREGDGSPS